MLGPELEFAVIGQDGVVIGIYPATQANAEKILSRMGEIVCVSDLAERPDKGWIYDSQTQTFSKGESNE